MNNDLQTRVCTITYGENILVDVWDNDKVWLSIGAPNGTRNCQLTIENAKDLIAALNKVVEGI